MLRMISGVRPSGSGSSAGSPTGSLPSGSSRAARYPCVRCAFTIDMAAATWYSMACEISPEATTSASAGTALGNATPNAVAISS